MKTSIQSRRRSGKLTVALLAAALSGLLVSSHAAAQWNVIDPTHIKTQLAEFGKEAARWGEQGRQWYKEYQQFMQQYNSFLSFVDNMQSSFRLPQGTLLEEIPDPGIYMVEERCGSPYGSGVTGVLGRLTKINMQQDIHEQRWVMCAKLQIMSNERYNVVVEYLSTTTQDMQNELNRAGNAFLGGNKTQGEMEAYSAKLKKVEGDMERSHDEFAARMVAYANYAQAMERAQGSLTRSTMRGGAGLIRQVTSTAVMYERLCGDGQCD